MRWLPGMNYIQKRMSQKIVNQDILMLQGQHQRLNQGAKAYNQAINADKAALTFRRWLEQALTQESPWFTGFDTPSTAMQEA